MSGHPPKSDEINLITPEGSPGPVLIEKESDEINLITPEGSPGPVLIEKEPTPPPPEPKVVTSGLAISMPGAAAETRRVSFETAQIRKDAKAGWNAACGQADPKAKGPAPTVVKSEPGAGGSAATVVKPCPTAPPADMHKTLQVRWAVPGKDYSDHEPDRDSDMEAPGQWLNQSSLRRVRRKKVARLPSATVVKPEAGAGETTEESSEEERPRAGGKMRVHKPPGPGRKPYER